MKKSIILLVFILCCSCLFAERVYVGGLYYNLNTANSTAEVTYEQLSSYGNYNSYYKISIPQSISYQGVNYQVTGIGTEAFFCGYNLESVDIPSTIISIGNKAFCSCARLASITIPESVISIGESAFSGCTNLKYLIGGNSVKSIDKYCFRNCSNLNSVNIPNSVTSIKEEAFSYCSKLTNITIGESVNEIGNNILKECNNLRSINWLARNYTNINENIIFGDDISKQITSFTFGENVRIIPCRICRGMTNLSSIVIPNTVIEIGTGAFEYCSGLLNVEIPDSVVTIGDGTFYKCSSLNSIILGRNVTNIGVSVFFNCSSLNNITVSDQNPKYNSRDNSNAIIETGTNTLIYGCKNTNIPQGVTCIGEGSFIGCSSLATITIPNSVTSIGDYAFGSCYNLTLIEIANSVTSIGDYAFSECWSLKSITIPNSVTNIGISAFLGCKGLTSFTIPNKVKSIGEDTFSFCTSLASITIPSNVESIGDYAFYECSSLTKIFDYSTEPQIINENVFYNVDKSACILYVLKESIDLYREAPIWKEFANIVGVDAPQGFEKYQITFIANKVIKNGQVLILSSDKTYTVTGQEVK